MRKSKRNVGGVSMTVLESAVGDINFSYSENCSLQGKTPGLALKYVNYGIEQYYIRDQMVSVKKGQLLFLRNNVSFFVTSHKTVKKTKGCCVNFNLDAMPSLGNLFNNDVLFCLPFSISLSSELGKKLNSLSKQSNDLSKIYENQFDYLKSDITSFAHDVRQFQERLSLHSKKNITIQAILGALFVVRDYIHNHYFENFSLDHLARRSGISKYYFLRLFKDCFGMTPLDLKHTLRMKSAQKKIEYQNDNLSQIAFDLGYPDLASFSKKFKTHYGCPPSQYLKLRKI